MADSLKTHLTPITPGSYLPLRQNSDKLHLSLVVILSLLDRVSHEQVHDLFRDLRLREDLQCFCCTVNLDTRKPDVPLHGLEVPPAADLLDLNGWNPIAN